MSIETRLRRLEGKGDAAVLIAASEHEAVELREHARLACLPALVLVGDPPPREAFRWGSVAELMARVAKYGKPIHEGTSHAQA